MQHCAHEVLKSGMLRTAQNHSENVQYYSGADQQYRSGMKQDYYSGTDQTIRNGLLMQGLSSGL